MAAESGSSMVYMTDSTFVICVKSCGEVGINELSQLNNVKDSLSFIAKFCIDSKIYLHQYPYHHLGHRLNQLQMIQVLQFLVSSSSTVEQTHLIQTCGLHQTLNQLKY